jgi:ribose-phosphate pyrophosphokinase
MIVSGSHSQTLAAELAAHTGEPLTTATYERFPDGELLAAVPEFDGDRAVVVAATPTSDAHIELLQLQDAVREAGASEVVTVIPYMGYARQDAAFEHGQPVSARAVARAIGTGTDRVLVVCPHEAGVLEHFGVPATAVEAAGTLARPLPADLTDPLFLAPDAGACDLAATTRDAYGTGAVDHFEKTRHSGREVTIEPSDTEASGRDVVLVDDIVATGSTMSEAVAALDGDGAERVFVCCVHPLLAENARTKLAAAGVTAVYGTDTLERAVSATSVAPIIADAL